MITATLMLPRPAPLPTRPHGVDCGGAVGWGPLGSQIPEGVPHESAVSVIVRVNVHVHIIDDLRLPPTETREAEGDTMAQEEGTCEVRCYYTVRMRRPHTFLHL